MEENNKNTNDLQDPSSVQKFEMGDDQEPKINHYSEQDQTPTEKEPNQQTVDPNNGLPTPPTQTINTKPPQTDTAEKPHQTPENPEKSNSKPKKKKSTKAAFMIFLSVFGGFLILFLILSFVFLAQAGDGQSSLARLLNLNEATFINGLIAFINFIFIVLALIAFLFTVSSLFKASMAKKNDKETKKKSLKKTFLSGSALFLVLIIWAFSFIYLDSKRVPVGPDANPEYIVTEPDETLQLTAPIDIRFDASNVPVNSRRYQIVSHQWDFGDGSSGTNQIVSHRYDQLGTYEVILTVNVQDKETDEILVAGQYKKTISITNQALTADFTADPISGEVPLEVTFDASESVDPDGVIDRYEWDLTGNNIFDDAEEKVFKHTFDKVGTYDVSLRVTTKTGEFNVTSQRIVVGDKEEPTAVIEIDGKADNLQTNVAYLFSADSSTTPNEKIEKYLWNFGDNTSTSTSKNVSHTFANAGTYEVSLTVTDDQGKTSTNTQQVTVLAPQGLPKAVILTQPALAAGEIALQGQAPFTVTFDARASTDPDNNITDYQWTASTSPDPVYGNTTQITFDQAGNHEVTLTVTDADGNQNSTTQLVEVTRQGITADLTADTLEGSAPLTVTFDASASSYPDGQITSYLWDFGDGTAPQLNASQMTHRFNEIGTYTTTVTAIGSDNTRNSQSITITVREVPLTACFNSAFLKGSSPLITTFDPSCSTGAATSYFWEFGDGGTSNQVKPQYTFENPGEYQVNLEISDNNNNISTFQKTIEVL